MPETTLPDLAARARALANDLFSTEALLCSRVGKSRLETCLMTEEVRPLTAVERAKNWHHRPFFAYDPERLCNGCAAYFFAERAAQTLHELDCWRVRIEADKARKLVQVTAEAR